jgi:hypothetical protein
MSDVSEQSILDSADAAAEAAARAARSGDSSSESSRPSYDAEREGALDDAFNEASKLTPPEHKGELGTENGGVVQPLEGAPKEEPKTEQDEVLPTASTTEPSADTGKKQGLLDSILSTETAEKKTDETPAVDPYDVKLRSDASPKTRETVENLKTVARQREAAARAETETAKAQLAELTKKVAELETKSVPDDIQTELKELREFRAQFAAEQTPEFKQKFDGRMDSNYDAIYKKLASHGLPETEITKLKGFSPQDRDATIENFLGKLDGPNRRFIEMKLADNLNVSEERARALAEARARADETLAKQKQAPVQQAQETYREVASRLKPAVERLPWLHLKDVPATAAPAEKQAAEAHNAFAAQAQEALKFVLTSDTPEAKAEAAIAVPLALHLRRENASLTTKVTALEKELNDIKNASRISRTARSSASSAAPKPAAAPVNEDREDALDRAYRESIGGKR